MSEVEGQIYSMDWLEFLPEDRIKLLEYANIKFTFHHDKNRRDAYLVIHSTGLSSTQRMILDFVQSPTRPVTFHNFDRTTGKAVLKVHNDFWNFYFNR